MNKCKLDAPSSRPFDSCADVGVWVTWIVIAKGVCLMRVCLMPAPTV